MKSLFEEGILDEINQRLSKLDENSQALWGKMSVDQMLKHCQLPLEVANGNLALNSNLGFFKKILFRAFKPLMYNDKEWKKNLETPREFKVTDALTFSKERDQLKTIIDVFAEHKTKTNWPDHPLFGKFTTEQWGKMQYKHLDHHLRQFGV